MEFEEDFDDLYEEDMNEEEEKVIPFSIELTPIIEDLEKSLMGDKFSNFDDFLKDLTSHVPHRCDFSVNSKNVVGFCLDCLKRRDSCLCLKCFFNGNHEGHRCGVQMQLGAFCDCGNSKLFNPECFCPEHKDADNFDPNVLDENVRTKLQEGFDQLLQKCDFDYPMDFGFLFEWINKLCKAGNPIVRLFNLSFIANVKLTDFFNILLNSPSWAVSTYTNLFSIFIYDDVFIDHILPVYLELLPKFFISQYSEPCPGYQEIISSNYIMADIDSFRSVISHGVFNPKNFGIEFYDFIFKLFGNLTYDKEAELGLFSWLSFSTDIPKSLYETEKLAEDAADFTCKVLASSVNMLLHGQIHKEFGEKVDDFDLYQICNKDLSIFYEEIAESMKGARNPVEAITVFYNELKKSEIYYPEEVLSKSLFANDFTFTSGVFPFVLIGLFVKENGRKIIDEFCSQNNVEKQLFIKNMTYLPLRLFTAIRGYIMKLFVRNDKGVHNLLKQLISMPELLIMKFGALQALFSCSDDKNDLVEFIAKSFGIFDEDNENIGLARFYFLQFIISLTTWNEFYSKDVIEWRNLYLGAYLSENDVPTSDFRYIYPDEVDVVAEIKKLQGKVEIVSNRGFARSHLEDTRMVSPYAPYENSGTLFSSIQYFINKNKNEFIPYPRVKDMPARVLDFVNTKFINAVVFDILYSTVHKLNNVHPSSIHFVNTIIGEYITENGIDFPESEGFSADNLKELTQKAPESLKQMMKMNIQYKGTTESIINLLKQVETPCQKIVSMIGENSKASQNSDNKVDKAKAAAMRAKILSQMKTEQANFIDNFSDDDSDDSDGCEDEKVCAVCQQSNDLCYMLYVTQSSILRWIGETEGKIFYGCRHAIHRKCVPDEHNAVCPLDRKMYNRLLPILKIPNDWSFEYSPVSEDDTKISEILPSLTANNIKQVEIRLRSPVKMYDLTDTIELNRAAFYFMRVHKLTGGKPEDKDEFLDFVSALANCDENPADKIIDVAKMINSTNLTFFRRVLVFDNLIFGRKHQISFEEVNKIFNTSFTKEDEPKPFEFNLPNEYLKLYAPPKFSPADVCKEMWYNVISGEVIERTDFLRFGQSIFIILTGSGASATFLTFFGGFGKVDPPLYYAEDMKTDNIGLDSMIPLYLNKEKVNALIDNLFTGVFETTYD